MAKVIRQQNVTILVFEGSYSSLNAQALEDAGGVMLPEATRSDSPRLVLDFVGTTYIGSSFIELLIRAWKRVRERHGKLALCGLQPFCLEILVTARLDQIFPCYATREEAVQAVASDTPQNNG